MRKLATSVVLGAAVAMATLATPTSAAPDSFLIAKEAAQEIQQVVGRTTFAMAKTADACILMIRDGRARGATEDELRLAALSYRRLIFADGMNALYAIHDVWVYTVDLLERIGVRPGVLARFLNVADTAYFAVSYRLGSELMRIEAELSGRGAP